MLKMDFIVMAAGNSRRFGKNKLLQPIQKRPMFTWIFDVLEEVVAKLDETKTACGRIFVVTQYEEILAEVEKRRKNYENSSQPHILQKENAWQPGVISPESTKGVSFTIRSGLLAAGDQSDYTMFLTADQPCLRAESILRLVTETLQARKGIGSLCYQETPGNPVLFHQIYRKDLMALEGDTGGRKIVKKHPEDCYFCPIAQKWELIDADTEKSLQEILDYFSET